MDRELAERVVELVQQIEPLIDELIDIASPIWGKASAVGVMEQAFFRAPKATFKAVQFLSYTMLRLNDNKRWSRDAEDIMRLLHGKPGTRLGDITRVLNRPKRIVEKAIKSVRAMQLNYAVTYIPISLLTWNAISRETEEKPDFTQYEMLKQVAMWANQHIRDRLDKGRIYV